MNLFLAIFYPNTEVDGKENLHFDSPAIVVSNHPNTLLDPLRAGTLIKQHLFFLVNATLFKSAIGNWFFSTFYCIKIERPKDIGGKKTNNKESLKACDDHLLGGGCLFIAPQGYSVDKRRIDKVKTGTARIALSAEDSADWKLGVKVIPFGLNYDSPRFYRTNLLVRVGKPLYAAPYRKEYEKDNFQAARLFTDDIQKAMEALILDTESDEEDLFVRQIEAIQQSEEKLNLTDGFKRSKNLVIKLHEVETDNYNDIKNTSLAYRHILEEKNIDDLAVKNTETPTSLFGHLKNLILLLLGFPFFLYGAINNLFTAGIPAILPKIINVDKGYDSNIKTLSGTFLWPLFYWLQTKLVFNFTDNWWIAGLYFLSIYPMGVLAWEYKEWFKRRLTNRRAKKAIHSDNQITEKRNAVLNILKANGF